MNRGFVPLGAGVARRWDYAGALTHEPVGFSATESVREYHLKFRPHEKPDAVIQVVT